VHRAHRKARRLAELDAAVKTLPELREEIARESVTRASQSHAVGREEGIMKVGAFALIDALGFKGIWKRVREEELLTKLRAMAKETTHFASFSNGMPDPVGSPGLMGDMHVSFLSDSIAVAVVMEKAPGESAVSRRRHRDSGGFRSGIHARLGQRSAATRYPAAPAGLHGADVRSPESPAADCGGIR
jgi:hypothetical protein